MNEEYNFNKDLKSVHSDYNFAQQMQNDSLNSLWRRKEGLWTLLSAACNDTAQECFEHIQNYTNKLIDIETCDIHSLKSIAKSVDLEFLTKNIKENYPIDILKLINILSVPRHILLNTNVLLHLDSNMKIFGEITKRSYHLETVNVSKELLYDIKVNIEKIKLILNKIGLKDDYNLLKLLKHDLKDLSLKSVFSTNFNFSIKDENYDYLQITLNEIISNIKNLRLNDISERNGEYLFLLKDYTNQSLKLNNSNTTNNKDNINYFYLIINIIKQNFYNEKYDSYIDGFIFNKTTNRLEDLSNLIMRIVSPIYYDNDAYINNFICFHFYNLIKSKLINNNIKRLYEYNDVKKIFSMNNKKYLSDFSEDEFKNKLQSYMSSESVDKFIENNKITIFSKSILTFVEYLSFINLYNGLNNHNNSIDEVNYDIIGINFPEKNHINDEFLISNINSCVMNIAKELSDIAIHISHLREDIKNNVQKYGIIGTEKIVIDNLKEFFIKNYTDNKDWNYQSNFIIDHYENFISSLFKPTSKLINKNEDNFSINLIEYYDTTDYLNIKSELGNVKIGEKIVGYENSEKYYLDENNLIASSYVQSPIYEDIYAPCSNFTEDYNEEFWKIDKITYSTFSDKNIEKYFQYYDQYFPELNENISVSNKRNFIDKFITPLITKVWEEFALSGYSESNENNELMELFKKYIGNNSGENRFLNHENKIFPTIAPFQNIENLVEINKYDSDILFLSKYYYKNVIESISGYSKLILDMYDDNGVPNNGWMQSYISFHGYTTKYQYSQKLTSNIKVSNKLIDVDGPWSYSTLQKIYFNHYEKVNIDINSLIQYADIVNDDEFSLSSLYDNYLNQSQSSFFFGEHDNISNYKIEKIEYDMFNNVYTLIKTDDNIFGKLIFRSFEMLIGLPFYEFIEYDGNWDDLLEILKNCVDFGIIEDFIWVFGKNQKTGFYQVISFKINYVFNHILIEDNSILYHSYDNHREFEYLNDFVGASYNEDLNELNFIFINQYNELNILSKYKHLSLSNYNLKFYIDCLNLDKNENYISILDTRKIDGIVFPLMLNDNENKQAIQINQNHRIWKNQNCDIKNYICYEAIDISDLDYFEYYKNLDECSFKFETLNISWKLTEFTKNNETFIDTKNIKITKGYNQILSLNNVDDERRKLEKISNFISDYPKCYIKNGHLNIDLIQFSISDEFERNKDTLILSLISHINAGKIKNNLLKFNDYSIIENISNNMIRNNLLNELSGVNEFLSSINFSFEDSDPVYISSSFELDSQSNKLFKIIPNSNKCLYEPLKIMICFENESGISFIDDFALDLDITCYINDKVEKFKKVGYGNKYQETKYISWSGDNNIKGFETLEIDILKYIRNNPNKNNYDFDDNIEIVLNVCWFNASQIKNGSVYALVSWQNILQKLPVKIIGSNGENYDKSCETRSIIFKVDKKHLTLTYDVPIQYFIMKIAKKHKLNGMDDNGIPDIQLGLINLDQNELLKLKNDKRWDTKSSEKYFIYSNEITSKVGTKEIEYITILFKDEVFDFESNGILYKKIKNIFDENVNIILKNDIDQIKKIFDWRTLTLNEIFFGCEYKNIDKETNANYFYFWYANPGFYKPSIIKSGGISNNILKLLKILDNQIPIYVSIKEEIQKLIK